MDVNEVRERLYKVKDRLFQEAQMYRERGDPVFPAVAALLPDTQVTSWSLGPVPGEVMLGVVAQAAQQVKDLGAVGAVLFAEGIFFPEGKDSEDSEDSEARTLLCYMAAPGWAEVWLWDYRVGAEGEFVWGEKPEFAKIGEDALGFRPFAYIPTNGVIH